jgi:hypothetical protein
LRQKKTLWFRTLREPLMTDNLFDSFETADEIMAFVLVQEGTEGLKQLLDILVAEHRMDQESLMEVAGRLEAAGLLQGAAIVMEAAEQIAAQARSETRGHPERSHQGQPGEPTSPASTGKAMSVWTT